MKTRLGTETQRAGSPPPLRRRYARKRTPEALDDYGFASSGSAASAPTFEGGRGWSQISEGVFLVVLVLASCAVVLSVLDGIAWLLQLYKLHQGAAYAPPPPPVVSGGWWLRGDRA